MAMDGARLWAALSKPSQPASQANEETSRVGQWLSATAARKTDVNSSYSVIGAAIISQKQLAVARTRSARGRAREGNRPALAVSQNEESKINVRRNVAATSRRGGGRER